MKTFLFLFIVFTLSVTPALAKNVAVVKMLRGSANALISGKAVPLNMNDWVAEGSVIKTAEKSFVKLIFVDKSQMNVGPNSEMKIETFSGKDSGVIDLVKGKIRSQVTKDYLQIDRDKSKLFIKTQNAVMGVRGTDFIISSNGQTSSVVLFEGEVVFNRLDRKVGDFQSLEKIVDAGVRMNPGEFSVVESNRPTPTVPSLLNVNQKETLQKNGDFNESSRLPSSSKTEVIKSVVPEGLSGSIVSNKTDTLKNEVAQIGALQVVPASSKPEGYVQGDKIKPTNGSFLHVDSGVIIPPAPDSILDANSNTYVAGSGNGSVASNGEYLPPKNMNITGKGEIFVTIQDERGKTVTKEIPKPNPVAPADFNAPLPEKHTVNPPNDRYPGGGIMPGQMNNQPAMDLRLQNQIENKTSTTTPTTIRIKE